VTTADWRKFETEVGSSFIRAGYKVRQNPKTAGSRQIDAYAQNGQLRILIEAKAQKRNLTVKDVDEIRSRLSRTPADVVGALFTTSGISPGAIQEIEQDHAREILVFGGREVRFIPACAGNTWSPTTVSNHSPVHPRVCGEHAAGWEFDWVFVGSSPRVRGTPRLPRRPIHCSRFIPACAGNTVKSNSMKLQIFHDVKEPHR
jgi:hypothetical protein